MDRISSCAMSSSSEMGTVLSVPSGVANLSAIARSRVGSVWRGSLRELKSQEGIRVKEKQLSYYIFITSTISSSQLSKLQCNTLMDDNQGKTLRRRLSQFILFWVRCRVVVDKFYVSVDE